MNDAVFVLSFAAAISCAVVGGVLFAFSGFVMRALARVSANRGISAMQSINITVQNPLCGLLFFGTGLICAVLIVWALANWGLPGTGYALFGGSLYVVGGLAVTGICNVPLNNKLAMADPESADGHSLWERFVPVWQAWNHVRTIACIAASVSFVAGLLQL